MRVIRTVEVPARPAPAHMRPGLVGGPVTLQTIEETQRAKDLVCWIVNFSPGARGKFHSHSTDQVLVITDGTGIVGTDKEEFIVTVGDVAHIPAGEKHWHGASKESPVSHIVVVGVGMQLTQLED